MSTITDPLILNPAAYVSASATMFGNIGKEPIAVTHTSPLPVRDRSSNLSFVERFNREGDPLQGNVSLTQFTAFPAPTGSGTSIAAAPPSPAVGRAIFVQSIQPISTTPIKGRWQLGTSQWNGAGSAVLHDIGFTCGPNSSPVIPVNAFGRSSDRIGVGGFISQWLDPTATGMHYAGIGASGWTLADSLNFDARKVILFLGDSLFNGTGPSTVESCIPWLVNKFYRDRGIDSRYILKAYSGSTTLGHDYFRKGGRYDFEQVDAIFYQLGTNDAAQGYTTVASMASIDAMIAWKQARYPDARLVIMGPPPVQNNTYEAALVAIRAAQAGRIAALNDPNILFHDQGVAFDHTDASNYVPSDGPAGTRIHPRDDGLGLMWNGGYRGFPGLKAWLLANLPAI